MRLRRSARVILFEPEGGVLLIRFVAENHPSERGSLGTPELDGAPFVFWVTPGGEIEAGEGERAAAARELEEELGLRLGLVGPVHRESGGVYTHLGETVRNDDVFFAGVCGRGEPVLRGVTAEEIGLMREARWWTMEELEGSGERVFPVGLAAVARRVWAECAL